MWVAKQALHQIHHQLCRLIADIERRIQLHDIQRRQPARVRNQTAELVVDLVESLFGKSTLINR